MRFTVGAAALVSGYLLASGAPAALAGCQCAAHAPADQGISRMHDRSVGSGLLHIARLGNIRDI